MILNLIGPINLQTSLVRTSVGPGSGAGSGSLVGRKGS